MNSTTGYTDAEVEAMVDEYFSSLLPERSAQDWLNLFDNDLDEWIYPGILCDSYTMFVGAPKSGKSQTAVEVASAITRGRPVLGVDSTRGNAPGNVLFITTESNGPKENLSRLIAADADINRVWIDQAAAGGTVPESSYTAAEAGNLALVVVDHIPGLCASRGVDTNSLDAVGVILSVANRFNAANVPVLFVHHANKGYNGDPVGAASGHSSIAGLMRHLVGFKMAGNKAFTTLRFNGNIAGGFDEPLKVTLGDNGRLSLVDSQQPKAATNTDAAEAAMAEIAKAIPGPTTKKAVCEAVATELTKRGFKNNRGKSYSVESIKKKLNSMRTLAWDTKAGFVQS